MEHDLLIRVDENVKNLVLEFSKFKDTTNNIEVRLRVVESAMIKLEPIPSVSHASVVKDIRFLGARIDILTANQNKLLYGWRGITVLAGILAGILSAIYYLVHLSGK